MKKAIFTEFRQGSEGYGRAYEGSGLGLSITNKIVALFNGTLSVESIIGVGSTFTIEIPYSAENVVEEIAEPIKTPAKTEKRAIKPNGLLPLLIVEDNPVNQKLAMSFLKNHFEVESAINGEIAIEMAEKKNYSVILMDINLGSGIDGIQATQILRKMPQYKHTPIIAVTGYTLMGDRERILAGGCSHYLGKPFSKEQLLETIQIAME
ncbi:MAG: response regulator [Candidatus Cloacimonadaceae bacterium]|nr:response regulator [Candidatus Cloacimonadaceae bacterium]